MLKQTALNKRIYQKIQHTKLYCISFIFNLGKQIIPLV